MAKSSTPSLELESIDRLEEKLKLLVGVVDRLKAEQAAAAAENTRLQAEIDTLRSRVAAGETLSTELTTLREERDEIRTRVADMLQQLEALDL